MNFTTNQESPHGNRFFVLRHGRSEANEAGLIASSPAIALDHYGLTPEGQDQVRDSVLAQRPTLGDITMIYTSDFCRTRETAQIAAEILNVGVEKAPQLRERFFGEWDGTSDANYQTVWEADRQNPKHEKWGVESVNQVASRMVSFIDEINKENRDQTYLLVSHGDPLQILITATLGHDLSLHRRLEPLGTAELRRLR